MNMKFFRGYTELEEMVLQEGKKLIDVAAKYLKLFKFPDSEAPNILEMRARRSLLAHHYNWVNGEISQENYETTALQSMEKSAYVHRFFLDFLCIKGLHKNALMFAVELGGNLETFPKKLKEYCIINPQAVKWAEEDVKRKQEAKRKQQEEDEQKQCQLDDSTPIIW
uniref:Uncharacterized protein n=1 Tax=Ditylenchus dipsaci TaxID=166011 RepID=A0A915EKR8_9BILA